MEMLILLNSKFIGKCRCCTNLLKWVVKILKKWDDIRFIDTDEAFSLALIYKEFVKKKKIVLEHFKQNRHHLRLMSYRAKRYKNHYELMQENVDFFKESLKIYTEVRNFIYNGIKTYIDIYNVVDFKNDLVFD